MRRQRAPADLIAAKDAAASLAAARASVWIGVGRELNAFFMQISLFMAIFTISAKAAVAKKQQ